ncbi:MAG: hypothetical protein ABUL58_00845, partial [Steroidobacter sp.]
MLNHSDYKKTADRNKLKGKLQHGVIWLSIPLAGAVMLAGCGRSPGSLEAAAEALNVNQVKTVEFSGTGKWYQFGQAPAPTLAWPAFEVSNYQADINYDTASERVQITRKQIVEPDRQRPTPVEQKPDQYVAGNVAWNLAPPPNSPPNTAAVPASQPAAVEERAAEIWATPYGFIKAAVLNKATSKATDNGSEVEFTVAGKYRYVGLINKNNQVERVQTWIDNPVLGDTLV